MIDWENIQSVFLDMDGTLLDLNFDNHFWQEFVPQRFAERNRLAPDEAKALLRPRFRAMEGRLEWYCLDYWSEQLQLDIAGMKAEIDGLIAVLPHVTEFLEAVRRMGKRLVLVTNAHPKSLDLKMEKTCLNAFFDAIISSHFLGSPKEDIGFWHRLDAVESFNPEHTLLVDDSLSVLRAARAFGIRHPIAVRRHDSTKPSRNIREFPAIDDFRELMPACVGA
jgi:HAD superfamily hydrolase (TIGR01509 family)